MPSCATAWRAAWVASSMRETRPSPPFSTRSISKPAGTASARAGACSSVAAPTAGTAPIGVSSVGPRSAHGGRSARAAAARSRRCGPASDCAGCAAAERRASAATVLGETLPLSLPPRRNRPRPSAYRTRKPRLSGASCSAPGEIRTPDLRFRRPTLYPAELRALKSTYPSGRAGNGFSRAQGAGTARRSPQATSPAAGWPRAGPGSARRRRARAARAPAGGDRTRSSASAADDRSAGGLWDSRAARA